MPALTGARPPPTGNPGSATAIGGILTCYLHDTDGLIER